MTERTNHRTLEQIGYELSYTLRDQTTGKLIVGSLLNEAKELIEHGDWLPFLKLYRIEARSAQNYMKAATWADTWADANTKPVSYLSRIAPKAIYALASGKYTDDVVEQVISAAQHRHIGLADVKAIAKVGQKAPILKEIKAALEAEAAAEKALEDARAAERLAQAKAVSSDIVKADEGDAASIDDNADDDAEIETALRHVGGDLSASKFDEAVEMLRKLGSKSLAIFDDTKTATDVIDEASRFLDEVSQRRNLHDMPNMPTTDRSKFN